MPRLLLLAAVLLLLACGAQPSRVTPSPVATPASATLPLSLRWASIEYFQGGPSDPVVEMRIIVENRGLHTTDSTTILWEPLFQQSFTFLRSDPPAWRVRTDDAGRGVLDTTGTIPGQYSTFHLWFVANAQTVIEPQVTVVANGSFVVADTVAAATHLKLEAESARQDTFESGPVAATADLLRFIPSDQHAALPLAAAMGLALSAMACAGGFAAYRLAGRRM